MQSIFNLFFIICFIVRFINNSIGFFNRSKIKWSNNFFIKMFASIFLSVNYFAFSILLSEKEINFMRWKYLYDGVTWFISITLFYFEWRRRMKQTWPGLRGFWFTNAIIYLTKIITFYVSEVIFL